MDKGQILVGQFHHGDVVDVDFEFFDEVKQEIEWALEVR